MRQLGVMWVTMSSVLHMLEISEQSEKRFHNVQASRHHDITTSQRFDKGSPRYREDSLPGRGQDVPGTEGLFRNR